MNRPEHQARVCLIIPSFQPGGAERVFTVLAGELARSGTDVCLIVLNGEGILGSAVSPHVRVIDLKTPRVRSALIPLWRALRKERPEAVLSTLGHLNMLLGLLRVFFPGTRFFAREACIVSRMLSTEKHGRLWAFAYRLIYPLFDRLVCQSRSMHDDLRDNIGLPESLLTIIHNPVDIESITRASEAPSPFPPGKKIVLFVGRFVAVKRTHLLAELMEKLASSPDIEMHFLGDGNLLEETKAAFAARGLAERATFWGNQPNPYAFMRHAACLVLPSSHEGFPNVILEAGACGIPAFSFLCPGFTEEIIQDGINGWRLAEGDIEGMARRILALPEGVASSETIRKHVASNFSLPRIAADYKKLLSKVA